MSVQYVVVLYGYKIICPWRYVPSICHLISTVYAINKQGEMSLLDC